MGILHEISYDNLILRHYLGQYKADMFLLNEQYRAILGKIPFLINKCQNKSTMFGKSSICK